MIRPQSTSIRKIVGLQIVFGLLISLSSLMAGEEVHLIPVNTQIPNSIMEIVMLILGCAVVICFILLRKAHIKHAVWQIVIGLLVAIISSLLVIGIADINGNIFGLKYEFILFALGLIVVVLGFMQLTLTLKGSPEVEEEKVVQRTYATGLRRRII